MYTSKTFFALSLLTCINILPNHLISLENKVHALTTQVPEEDKEAILLHHHAFLTLLSCVPQKKRNTVIKHWLALVTQVANKTTSLSKLEEFRVLLRSKALFDYEEMKRLTHHETGQWVPHALYTHPEEHITRALTTLLWVAVMMCIPLAYYALNDMVAAQQESALRECHRRYRRMENQVEKLQTTLDSLDETQ